MAEETGSERGVGEMRRESGEVQIESLEGLKGVACREIREKSRLREQK